MTYFVGEKLQPCALRFNYSSVTARHLNSRQGLRTYGPYDSSTYAKERIVCAVVYPAALKEAKKTLVTGLSNGYGQFSGFRSLFRVPLVFLGDRCVAQETPFEVQNAVRPFVADSQFDFVFILTSNVNERLYAAAKAELLGNGVPNQVITAYKLMSPSQLPWVLENVALQCYAKMGGTPWTVASFDNRRELIIGISRAQDRQKKFVVGFITLFTQDGDYQFMSSMAPKPVDWEDETRYREGLTELILRAYEEYSCLSGEPESVVLHLCKRPGRFREVQAIENAMKGICRTIPYALVHLNDGSNYRLFDASHRTYIPETGLKVEVTERSALLMLDGRTGDRDRLRRGVPRVLEVSLDRRSTMGCEEFPRLVRQVFDFARVNWRGFNAQAVPATLNYSYLVARLVAEVGADRWNDIVSAGRLRDKAWFL